MIVRELIEKLNQLPLDLEVYSEIDCDFVGNIRVGELDGKVIVILE